MAIGEICNREVVVAQRDCTILEAAQLMRQHHVGDVVVVEQRGGINVPVGLVTDRDLVVEIMAPAIDQAVITVGDIMTSDLVTVKESAGVSETIEYMRVKGVRRVPVVSENGGLLGILALDDLLELLSEELLSLSRLVRHEQKREMMSRR
ncbi:MAG: CBS domain-containing protein [Gallionella sp.]|nr:CBS domain-containing protein [Gallionella sp.]